ncbi:YdcF family protein [Leptolyngbya sp. KIOST-1]|uniref:YdcF family protein n=1 Tax=Leptolyngbya sp. KIOST-1 TaxID=1229172 RepID=UPI00056D30F9|nr:YdcF family protein [Leptolyngbya sp. KIOST-1]
MRSLLRLLPLLLLGWLLLLPLNLAIARLQTPQPQAILTLGGGSGRETFTAQFAQTRPDLPIWISSGIPAAQAHAIFQAAHISPSRYHLDYRATDTVTNFTTLVPDLKAANIQHIYLITSAFHMPRATAIATIVLGSQGIAFTSISPPHSYGQESPWRILRDTGRSLLWLTTGRTGSSLNPRYS